MELLSKNAYLTPYVCCLLLVLLFYRFNLISATFLNPGFLFNKVRSNKHKYRVRRAIFIEKFHF